MWAVYFVIEKIIWFFAGLINRLYEIYQFTANFIFKHSVQIIIATVGIVLFVIGAYLFFQQIKNKQNQSNENLEERCLESELLEASTTSKSKTVYTEGNYNENIAGDYVEIHGNQININNDFSQVAEQIREIKELLKSKGYTQEDAEEKIAKELEEKSSTNPRLKKRIYYWRKVITKKSNPVNTKEAAQDVVKSATSYSYIPSEYSTDIINGDFHVLNELLQSKRWEDADKETARIIYTVGQNELPDSSDYKNDPPDYVVTDHIAVLPRKYLINIDRLWSKHSNGRFSFTTQKRIWEKVCNKEDLLIYPHLSPFLSSSSESVRKFADSVGWRKGDDWLYYVDLYDPSLLKTAASGHLPLAYMLESDKPEKCSVDFDIFIKIWERLRTTT